MIECFSSRKDHQRQRRSLVGYSGMLTILCVFDRVLTILCVLGRVPASCVCLVGCRHPDSSLGLLLQFGIFAVLFPQLVHDHVVGCTLRMGCNMSARTEQTKQLMNVGTQETRHQHNTAPQHSLANTAP